MRSLFSRIIWEMFSIFNKTMNNGRNTGSTNCMDRVIFLDFPNGFSSDSCTFLYASFVETSSVGNANVSLLRILERKTTHETHSTLQYKKLLIYSSKHFVFGTLSIKIKKWNIWSSCNFHVVFYSVSKMANIKSTFVGSDIDGYIATLRPRHLGHGINYYRSH